MHCGRGKSKLSLERGRGQETKGVCIVCVSANVLQQAPDPDRAVRPLRFTLAQAVLVREGAGRGGADDGSSASFGGSCVRRC